MQLTSRERFIHALERRPYKGLVPHFELVFFLTMETMGKVHPNHRHYAQWMQMTDRERQLHRMDMADVYIRTAEMFHHDAILLHVNPDNVDESIRLAEIIREKSGSKYFLMLNGDATYKIPSGGGMMDFVNRIADEPEKLHEEAAKRVDTVLAKAEKVAPTGLVDGYALTSDYCFNTGPFLSPAMFSEFVTPYLSRLIASYRDMGFYTIKHTDGNIMPILDQLAQANPHALHSIDPQAGVDIAEVKRLVGNQLCLIGNVNCGLIQTGTEEEVIESARYALKSGMPGGGYIFSTSNCVYTGMPLERYQLILDVWKKEGRMESPEHQS